MNGTGCNKRNNRELFSYVLCVKRVRDYVEFGIIYCLFQPSPEGREVSSGNCDFCLIFKNSIAIKRVRPGHFVETIKIQ
uniref:Uncharacterized protein n=1 Tax=Romanomermis culicivorax TaxID=13658 RepID=A0A915IWP5_ROMCU